MGKSQVARKEKNGLGKGREVGARWRLVCAFVAFWLEFLGGVGFSPSLVG
jgi:hypothetical protein